MENEFQNQTSIIWVARYALQLDKCTKQFHKAYESSSKALIGKFVVLYFHDILVYSCIEEEHAEHLHQVLSILA